MSTPSTTPHEADKASKSAPRGRVQRVLGDILVALLLGSMLMVVVFMGWQMEHRHLRPVATSARVSTAAPGVHPTGAVSSSPIARR